jgi:hypothetical protein
VRLSHPPLAPQITLAATPLKRRGHGYFGKLLRAVFARLRQENVDTVCLNALPGSTCCAVYTRLGFTPGPWLQGPWVFTKGVQNTFVRKLDVDDENAAAAAAAAARSARPPAALFAGGGGGGAGGHGGCGGAVQPQVARKFPNRAPAASAVGGGGGGALFGGRHPSGGPSSSNAPPPPRAAPAPVPGTAAAAAAAAAVAAADAAGQNGPIRKLGRAASAMHYAADDAADTDPDAGAPPDWPEKHVPFVSAPLWYAFAFCVLRFALCDAMRAHHPPFRR